MLWLNLTIFGAFLLLFLLPPVITSLLSLSIRIISVISFVFNIFRLLSAQAMILLFVSFFLNGESCRRSAKLVKKNTICSRRCCILPFRHI